MTAVNLLFPGQGSQYVGMAKDLIEKPAHHSLIEAVKDALGFDLIDIMLNGPEEKLKLTEYTQPAIVLHSYLLYLELTIELKKRNILIGNVMGHSVGEYAALVAAGSLTISDALKAVHQRGKFMQNAVAPGMGKMLAILKVSQEKIEEGCQVSSTESEKVMPANYNAPTQTVVSGHSAACDRLAEWLKENIDGPYRAVELKVSAPFHSSLMLPAAENLEQYLNEISFAENKIPYIANINGKLFKEGTSPEVIKNNLINQVAGSVLWTQSFNCLTENERCLEVGPGKTLMGLGRSINRNIQITPLDGANLQEVL
jgi:[acyl-carrier-protein] S-malonyltransferase